MTPRPHEQGVALLSVLLIIGLMAVVSAAMLDRIVVASHLAANSGVQTRAHGYAQAVETIARVRIGDAMQAGQLPPEWQTRPLGFRVPEGAAVARLSDGGNCLNVNSVVQQDRVTGAIAAYPEGIEQFANLASLLGVPRIQGERIATAVADWIDSDSIPMAGGAEDGGYAAQGAIPPNRLIDDPSEIVGVQGMTPEIASRLLPWMCALPVGGLSPINIDTLPPERAELFAMLGRRGLSVATARSILSARPAQGYQTVQFVRQLPALAGVEMTDGAWSQLQVTPRWFDLQINVQLAGAELNQQILIDGQDSPARIVRRRRFEP